MLLDIKKKSLDTYTYTVHIKEKIVHLLKTELNAKANNVRTVFFLISSACFFNAEIRISSSVRDGSVPS